MDRKNDELITGVLPAGSDQQIAAVLALVDTVLGPDVLGAYLYGSAVLAGLRLHGDLDILVVSARPTTREEKRRLVTRLLTISSPDRRDGQRPVARWNHTTETAASGMNDRGASDTRAPAHYWRRSVGR